MKKSSIFFLLTIVLFSGMSQAENLKNSEFLELSEGQRHWWYSGAFMALGHVAFNKNEEKGQCVWKWFFADPKKKEALLLKSFKKFPNHTPTSIVIALLRRDCNVFLE